MAEIPRHFGRAAFGAHSSLYNQARPAYPGWIFDLLVAQNALYPDARTLEIGPGSGQATATLARLGAAPITLVEPDQRFAEHLDRLMDHAGNPCHRIQASFEQTELPPSSFDLIVVATAFHWLDPASRTAKLADLTRTGGHVALIWNVFQDLHRSDAFHEATKQVLEHLPQGPSGKPGDIPFVLDRESRQREFTEAGQFELTLFAEGHWTLQLDPAAVRILYQSFSNVSRLPAAEQSAVLDHLEQIAATEFEGTVARNMTTPLYLFKRR